MLYPPTNKKLAITFVWLVVFIFCLLFYAWVNGQWLKHVINEWLNTLITFLVCLIFLWLSRLNKVWIFEWKGNHVTIDLKGNIFYFVWLDIFINKNLVLKRYFWKTKKIDIYDSFDVETRTLPINVKIEKTADEHQLGCAVSINGDALSIKQV